MHSWKSLAGQFTGHTLLIVWSLYLRSCYLHDMSVHVCIVKAPALAPN